MPQLRRIVSISTAAAICLLMSSCGSQKGSLSARRAPGNSSSANTTVTNTEHITIDVDIDSYTRRLLSEADKWLGTPYKYGGETPDGVDCSGFVLNVYRDALGIKLPRNSAKQQEYCTRISKNQLQEGDLVFFTVRGGRKVGHVGIYIGHGKMIHSSSSKGVIVSPLSQKYYVDNFYSAGRVDALFAMKANMKKTQKPTKVVNPCSTAPQLVTDVDKQSKKSTVRFTKATPGDATAHAMEENRRKALQSLLTQVEDSLETLADKSFAK